ncbi:MAG: hypothetical protein NC038_03080 [Paludibacter sp.]|nr:hypothetical protein [Bacteroidales bacterium]MCM1069146.1 hypothetical protein [Prevotella sp.]MCM1353585.1 hypothetical protein [Bacteroides sp.]MCM1442746.1 hypothetical protein [Muribaculum sp.]MCM1481618.1 hypothetical protein [Paludibacter sp.]
MKHFSLKTYVLLFMSLYMSHAVAATYCGETITSTNGKHAASITCSSLGNNMYQFVFASEDAFTGYNAAGSNFYMNVNGVGGYHVSEHLAQDGNKLTALIESDVVPNIYVGAFFVVYEDGECMYEIPTDADFSQQCGDVEEDTEKPVMGTAAFLTATFNTATVEVNATPAEKIVSYVVKSGNDEIGSFAPSNGTIVINGLQAGTAYTVQIYAKKQNGLLSDNYAELSFTTENVSYCNFATGHEGNAEFGDPNGRILVSIYQLNATTVRLQVTPNTAAGATRALDLLYVEAAGAEPVAYTVGEDIAEGEGSEKLYVDIKYSVMPALCSFSIQWSHPAWEGRWAATLKDVDTAAFCTDEITALETVATQEQCTKLMQNGQLIILRNGVRYNALGQIVK